jgi:hypothetical protein
MALVIPAISSSTYSGFTKTCPNSAADFAVKSRSTNGVVTLDRTISVSIVGLPWPRIGVRLRGLSDLAAMDRLTILSRGENQKGMAKKKSAKATIKPKGWPEIEIPNDLVLQAADQYRDATVLLFATPDAVLLPLYTLGGLAIELYLKSLNSKWIFTPDSIDPNADPLGLVVTAEPSTFGHVFAELFDALPAVIRIEIETAYKTAPMVQDAPTCRDALVKYEGAFVQSRYSFEHTEALPAGSLSDFLSFIQFLGTCVRNLSKRPASWY